MPTPHGFVERLAELSQSGVPFVCVTMVQAVGSTPQDAGSKMLVTAAGLMSGTVGGGKVEHKAIQHAQEMIAQPTANSRQPIAACELVEWNLKRDVGMTCGGSVKLFFETYNHSDWRVVVFGAGHVAGAVVECLAPLDCHVSCIDPRSEWLDRIPARSRLRKVQAAEPSALVAELPGDAFVICMTMGHATDRPILEEIFRQNREFPFLGVIGSKAKRAVLLKELTATGIAPELAEQFYCPIGLELGTNQPGEIAISVVAQLIQERIGGVRPLAPLVQPDGSNRGQLRAAAASEENNHMSTRELIERELEVLPEPLQREVYDFVCFLKLRTNGEAFNGLLSSEAVLARDWDTAEEDAAWQNL